MGWVLDIGGGGESGPAIQPSRVPHTGSSLMVRCDEECTWDSRESYYKTLTTLMFIQEGFSGVKDMVSNKFHCVSSAFQCCLTWVCAFKAALKEIASSCDVLIIKEVEQ